MSFEGGKKEVKKHDFGSLLNISPETALLNTLEGRISNAKKILGAHDVFTVPPASLEGYPPDIVEAEILIQKLRTVADEADALLVSARTVSDDPSIVPDVAAMSEKLRDAYQKARPFIVAQASGVGGDVEDFDM